MNEKTKRIIDYLQSNNVQVVFDGNPSQARIDLIKKVIEGNKEIRGDHG